VPQADRQHRKGVALIIAAAVAWSTAPFFTRLALIQPAER
jgi:hypothetical protein